MTPKETSAAVEAILYRFQKKAKERDVIFIEAGIVYIGKSRSVTQLYATLFDWRERTAVRLVMPEYKLIAMIIELPHICFTEKYVSLRLKSGAYVPYTYEVALEFILKNINYEKAE